MGEVLNITNSAVFEAYRSFTVALPSWGQTFINFFFLVLLVVIYSVFIWKFYRFIATKNILGLNLNKYNTSSHPLFTKLIAGALYLLEYIIILPFIIFMWFSVFTFFLILLSEEMSITQILISSVVIIGAVRMISYIPNYGEPLAKEVAKLIPFVLLAVSLSDPKFFDIERIFTHFSEIPGLFSQITSYLVFIIILEVILRFFDFIFSLFGLEEETNPTENIE